MFAISQRRCVTRAVVARVSDHQRAALPKMCSSSQPALGRSQLSLRLTNNKRTHSSARVTGKAQRFVCTAEATEANPVAEEVRPKPKVRIDNLSDPMATIVAIEFGEYLGDLLDTVASLRNLKLNIVRAELDKTGEEKYPHKYYVTDVKNGEKVFDTERLESIRMTIMNNMILFHPEASPDLAVGQRGGSSAGAMIRDARERLPLGPRPPPKIPTSIKIGQGISGVRSRLDVVTGDRPGLMVDIVRTLNDISVTVLSAEIDTIGLMAHDVFFLTYKGTALTPPMEELVRNALYYYLVLGEVLSEESY